MISALLAILGEHGYLPDSYDEESIWIKLEQFIVDAVEHDLSGPLNRINSLLGIDGISLSDNLSEDIGPGCPYLGVNLQTKCGLRSCPNWQKNHEWNCKFLGNDLTLRDDDISQILGKVGKGSSAEILEEQFPPSHEYFRDLGCCVLCGEPEAKLVTPNHRVCDNCLTTTSGGINRIFIELKFGKPARAVLEYIIARWHSTPEQSRILGISTEELNVLYKMYSLNPTKYLTKDEKRFVNPFVNSKKTAKNTVDEYLQRVWFRYIGFRRIQSVREEVLKLGENLMIEANSFLISRKLEGFKQL
jgi:hypothetical protein